MAAAASALFALVLVLAIAAAFPAVVQADDKEVTHIKLPWCRPTTSTYWHDLVNGSNPTSVPVAHAAVTNASKTGFGLVMVIDDPLTDGPNLTSSAMIGHARGMYVSTGKDEATVLMNMNFVFTAGEYNGSSVAIVGPNAVLSTVREMSITGGTGVFRWARGYVEARTHAFDLITGDATVEYNVFIKH